MHCRFLSSLHNGIFPVGPEALAGNTVLVAAMYLAGVDLTFGFAKAFVDGVNAYGQEYGSHLFCCLLYFMLHRTLV